MKKEERFRKFLQVVFGVSLISAALIGGHAWATKNILEGLFATMAFISAVCLPIWINKVRAPDDYKVY